MNHLMKKTLRVMRKCQSLVIFTILCLGFASCSRSSLIDPRTTLHCHVRTYSFRASKPPILNKNGDLVTCQGDVRVSSCWGRCDSSETGDFKMPFKVSSHPVCTYTGRVSRIVHLSQCHGYPDPTLQVFDATGCTCRLCNSDYTSCENLSG